MKKTTISALLSLLCIATVAQSTTEPKLKENVDPSPYAETITVDDLKRHLYEISGDDYEGRETGYAGQKKCEEYMVGFYKSIGLPPVKGSYVQEFMVNLNDPKRVKVSKNDQEFTFIEDFYYYPGTGDRVIEGDVVYSGYGITDKKYTDLNIFDIKDKIVMVWDGEPKREDGLYKISRSAEPSEWSVSTEKKRIIMEEAGAKAMMIIKPNYADRIDRLSKYFSHKGMTLANDDDQVDMSMPVIHITEKMATELLGEKEMKKAKKQLAKLDVDEVSCGNLNISFERSLEKLSTTNVMGFIEGSDLKDEIVVLSAHYDHIGVEGELVYNGADDDGSGTVTCMEIAEAFALAKAAGNGPRRSILVLNVSAEEKGLLGSQYYVENPIFPLENTVVDLNIDMIGRLDEHHPADSMYLYLIGSDFLSQDLHDVNVEVNKKHLNLNLDMRYNSTDDPNQFYYRSDHYNFAKNNVPSVFYFTGVHEDYHKPTDTVDKIMFHKLSYIAQHIFYTAWEIANRDERLRLNGKQMD